MITKELLSNICEKHRISLDDLTAAVIIVRMMGLPLSNHGVNILKALTEAMEARIQGIEETEALQDNARNN